VAIARAIGIIGILGTLALAVYAVSPHAPTIARRAEGVFGDVRLPWVPVLNDGPAPTRLDWQRMVMPPSINVLPATATTQSPPPASAPAESAPAESASPESAPTPTAPEPTAPEPTVPEPSAPKRVDRQERSAKPPPPLTPEEIQRRQERYEQWLKEQQLERIH
jgi:hypothetical protein